ATVAYGTVLAASVCMAVGVIGMFGAEWWSRRIAPPASLRDATRRGNRRLVVMIVLGVVGLAVVRSAAESPSPIPRAVAFGLLSGVSLGGAIVLPFDKRRRLPFVAPRP